MTEVTIMFETFMRRQHLRGLNINALPEEEMPHGNILWLQLQNLESGVARFADALELFDTYAGDPRGPHFKFVHRGTPVGKIDSALRQFGVFFPDAVGVRDSVGHTSELMSSPARLEENSLADGRVSERINIGEKGIWLNNLVGRRFSTTTFGGKLVEYEISKATLRRLNDLTNDVFAAFSPT